MKNPHGVPFSGGGGIPPAILFLGRGADLYLVADPKAHKRPGVEHDGCPDDSAYRSARGYR